MRLCILLMDDGDEGVDYLLDLDAKRSLVFGPDLSWDESIPSLDIRPGSQLCKKIERALGEDADFDDIVEYISKMGVVPKRKGGG